MFLVLYKEINWIELVIVVKMQHDYTYYFFHFSTFGLYHTKLEEYNFRISCEYEICIMYHKNTGTRGIDLEENVP